MDPFVGPLRDKPSCGYNPGEPGTNYEQNLDCDATPVVVHIMFNTLDDEGLYPGGFACAEHVSAVPSRLVLMQHEIKEFCTLPGSEWNIELNECLIPLDFFEKQLLGEVVSTNVLEKV